MTSDIERFNGKSARWMKVYDLFRWQNMHYRNVFNPNNPDGMAVLKDLAKFCRANGSTIGPTQEQTYALIGRREVWLRIQQRLNLSPEQLTEINYGQDQETNS